MYKILLISTIMSLVLGGTIINNITTNTACTIPTGGSLKAKTYTGSAVPFDTTWTILSSSQISSQLPMDSEYFTTIIYQKGNSIKIQTITASLMVFEQVYDSPCNF